MRRGEVILILGAGASYTSRNMADGPVKTGLQLAETIAEEAALPYDNEKLTEVLSAVEGPVLSSDAILRIYQREYRNVKPSQELESLFNFCWKRIYTWNIDDSLENVAHYFSQRVRFYNGMADRAAVFEDAGYVHCVYLHGQITKPTHGFIMTETKYAEVIKSDTHYWYQQAAQDYLGFTPVFIGTTIDEPVLTAELERAKREGDKLSGKAFVITPSALSPIKSGALAAKGIIHIQASLEQFVAWLNSNFPDGIKPREIIENNSGFSASSLDRINKTDLPTAKYIRVIDQSHLSVLVSSMKRPDLELLARQYLRGFPPTWRIAASEVPVDLEANKILHRGLESLIKAGGRAAVITGQAGSGKTTSVMQFLLSYQRKNKGAKIYELGSDAKNLPAIVRLLKRLHGDEECIVFIKDLFLFGEEIKPAIEAISDQRLTFISTARSGEWKDSFASKIGSLADVYKFERFSRRDFGPLIKRLSEFVPSPAFNKLTPENKEERLAKSKNQLLIALREVTESESFDDVITNEFQGLPDSDTRYLFTLIGIATLARVGISHEMAAEAYGRGISKKRSFGQALDALDGIVSANENGRLLARHDLYVRHIFDSVINFDELKDPLINLLACYKKYEVPVIRRVTRQDASLFKFLLNNRFIAERARVHGDMVAGIEIYSAYEIEFQQDGHFWLQFGLYLAEARRFAEAVEKLRRSTQAYSENQFAIHALADVQLRLAKERDVFDATTKKLIDDAVRTLLEQDTRSFLELDTYPAVTLAYGHVGALQKHLQTSEAIKCAKIYFDRLQELDKRVNDEGAIKSAKEAMMTFITTGTFPVKLRKIKGRNTRRRRR